MMTNKNPLLNYPGVEIEDDYDQLFKKGFLEPILKREEIKSFDDVDGEGKLSTEDLKLLNLFDKIKENLEKVHGNPVMNVLKIAAGYSLKEVQSLTKTDKESFFSDLRHWHELNLNHKRQKELEEQLKKEKSEKEKEQDVNSLYQSTAGPIYVEIFNPSEASRENQVENLAQFVTLNNMKEAEEDSVSGAGMQSMISVEAYRKNSSKLSSQLQSLYQRDIKKHALSFREKLKESENKFDQKLKDEKEKESLPQILNKRQAFLYLLQKGRAASPTEVEIIDELFNSPEEFNAEWLSHPYVNGIINLKDETYSALIHCQNLVLQRLKPRYAKQGNIIKGLYEIYAGLFGKMVGYHIRKLHANRFQIPSQEIQNYELETLFCACQIADSIMGNPCKTQAEYHYNGYLLSSQQGYKIMKISTREQFQW